MTSTGYCVLAAGVVLAMMVVPIIIHVVTEVLQTIPFELREASWSLGATQWETIRYVVMRRAMGGIIAAVVLGLSTGLGRDHGRDDGGWQRGPCPPAPCSIRPIPCLPLSPITMVK